MPRSRRLRGSPVPRTAIRRCVSPPWGRYKSEQLEAGILRREEPGAPVVVHRLSPALAILLREADRRKPNADKDTRRAKCGERASPDRDARDRRDQAVLLRDGSNARSAQVLDQSIAICGQRVLPLVVDHAPLSQAARRLQLGDELIHLAAELLAQLIEPGVPTQLD